MNILRRQFLTDMLTTSSALMLSAWLPRSVMAEWPNTAFAAKTPDTVIKALFNHSEITDSDKIEITTPTVAENGAIVPVEIFVKLPKVESITIIADRNPVPLIGQFNFPVPENTIPWVKTRIKMGTTSHLIAVVKADGKLYRAQREVKVTVGGCGAS